MVNRDSEGAVLPAKGRCGAPLWTATTPAVVWQRRLPERPRPVRGRLVVRCGRCGSQYELEVRPKAAVAHLAWSPAFPLEHAERARVPIPLLLGLRVQWWAQLHVDVIAALKRELPGHLDGAANGVEPPQRRQPRQNKTLGCTDLQIPSG